MRYPKRPCRHSSHLYSGLPRRRPLARHPKAVARKPSERFFRLRPMPRSPGMTPPAPCSKPRSAQSRPGVCRSRWSRARSRCERTAETPGPLLCREESRRWRSDAPPPARQPFRCSPDNCPPVRRPDKNRLVGYASGLHYRLPSRPPCHPQADLWNPAKSYLHRLARKRRRPSFRGTQRRPRLSLYPLHHRLSG